MSDRADALTPVVLDRLGECTPNELRAVARRLVREADLREARAAGRQVEPGPLRVTHAEVARETSWPDETEIRATMRAEDGKYRYQWTARWWVDADGERGVPGHPHFCRRSLLDATKPGGAEAGWLAREFRKGPPPKAWNKLRLRAEALWRDTPAPAGPKVADGAA